MTPLCSLLAATVSLVPVEDVVDDRFDVVHYNRHYDGQGQLQIEQVWWETWNDSNSQHRIAAWRLAHPGTCQSPIPLRNRAKHCWQSIWIDGHVLRRVTARSFRNSWTQGTDPELLDRQQRDDWRKTRRQLTTPP